MFIVYFASELLAHASNRLYQVYSEVVSNDAHAGTQSNVMDRNGARGLDEHQAAILAACQCQAYRSTRQLLIPSPSSSPSQRETFLPAYFRYAQPCFASHAPAPVLSNLRNSAACPTSHLLLSPTPSPALPTPALQGRHHRQTAAMRHLFALPLALLPSLIAAADLGIEVTRPVDCIRKSKKGDKLSMNYKGTLQKDGSQFDSSYDRGKPFSFKLGAGQVIAGWDQGLLDMCPGEARTLTIPPSLGYGNYDNGPIPAGSTLSMLLT
jgi:hypothetical protein